MTQRWIVSYEIEIPRCEQILDVTKAESEPEIEPDRLVNDLRREPITGIAGFRHALRLRRIQSASKLNAVEAVLDKARLSIDDVTQRTLEYKLDSFERLDRMLASAETRRNNALHEIDRHPSALGAAVRQAVEVEDVEFRDVETGITRGVGES